MIFYCTAGIGAARLRGVRGRHRTPLVLKELTDDLIDTLTTNLSDKQCDFLKVDESSSSLHSPKNLSKKIGPKNKSSNSQRKPSTITNKTVKSVIEAMKRKLSPEKEADTSCDNQKVSLNEHNDI